MSVPHGFGHGVPTGEAEKAPRGGGSGPRGVPRVPTDSTTGNQGRGGGGLTARVEARPGRAALFHHEEFPMPATGPQITTTEPALARSAGEDDMDAALDTFLAERTRLVRIAYRVLGDVAGAEDVVQEVWLRWQLTQRAEVDNPTAFLVTATTRLAIKVLRSARHRHEVQVEPQLAGFGDRAAPDPVLSVERSVAVDGALALLMARLTPDRLRPAQGIRLRLRRTGVPAADQRPERARGGAPGTGPAGVGPGAPGQRRVAPPPRRGVPDGRPHGRAGRPGEGAHPRRVTSGQTCHTVQ
ncbi:hypothetical protein M2161_001277 [Streptomyces sp. SAI-133]|nr:hypothetical protein [Streptomyces sp. SAI-133]